MPHTVRIVHVSDLHLEPAGSEQYEGLADRLDRIREDVAAERPDLVVASGDLTNVGSSRSEDFALARRWLESLGAPYLAVPGNHDLGANPERGESFPVRERYEHAPYQRTGFARHFGSEPVSRHDLEGLTVLGLALREDDPDGAIDALRQAIADSRGPVVVAGHYPVVEVRPWPSDEPFGAAGYVDRAAGRLRQLLETSDRVLAYLCGHVHLTSARLLGAHCQQFTAGGLGPGAAAYRVYEWNGTTWSYATRDADGPTTFWEDGVESARRDPNFSRGTESERSGSWSPPQPSPLHTLRLEPPTSKEHP